MMKKLLFVLLLSAMSWGQVTVVQAPVPKFRSFTPSGLPNVGGCVYTFASGTSTPQATYVDFTGLTANSNPVILDANGEAPIWISGVTYRFQVWSFGSGVIGSNCGNGTQLYQIDGVRDTGLNALNGPITIAPTSNGIDIFDLIRATDVSPSGNFVNFKSFAGATLFKVDINGNATAASLTSSGAISGTTGAFSGAISGTAATLPKVSDDGVGNAFLVSTSHNIYVTWNTGRFGWTSTGFAKDAVDTAIQRGTAGQVLIGNGTDNDFSGSLKTTTVNAVTGYQINGTSTSSHCLVGNGTNYVDGICPSVVASANLIAQNANVGPTTLTTPGANGFYRFSCWLVLTTAAGTSSTLPTCQYAFTDADSGVAETVIVLNTSGANSSGSVGAAAANPTTFFAKSGVAITYATASYASNPASAMQYAIHVRLEGPF